MESPGEPADLAYALGGNTAEALCLSFRLVDRLGICERTEADQQRRHQLTRFIVQFARNPAPLLFLRLKHTFEQQSMRRLRLFQSSNVRTSGFSLPALSDVARHGGRANNLATTRLDQRHSDGDVDDR